jgi:hypothetical protein
MGDAEAVVSLVEGATGVVVGAAKHCTVRRPGGG